MSHQTTDQELRALVSRLASDDLRWRDQAEQKLFERGADAIPLLFEALDAAETALRLHSARVLGRLAGRHETARIARRLIALFDDTQHHGAVAIAAEKSLAQLGPPAVGALVGAALEVNASLAARARAVRTLGRIGSPVSADCIRKLFADESAALRAQAAAAAPAVLGAGALEPLLQLAGDGDRIVQLAAAEALVALKSGSARAVLHTLGADPEDAAWVEALLERLDELARLGELLP